MASRLAPMVLAIWARSHAFVALVASAQRAGSLSWRGIARIWRNVS